MVSEWLVFFSYNWDTNNDLPAKKQGFAGDSFNDSLPVVKAFGEPSARCENLIPLKSP